jgi:hypothetical protein
MRRIPKLLALGFLGLAMAPVVIARGAASDTQLIAIVVAAAVLLTAGSVAVARASRRPGAWIAVGAFAVVFGAIGYLLLGSGGERAADIALSVMTIACAGAMAGLCAVAREDWAPFAALAAIGQLVVLPESALTEMPLQRIHELCAAHSGALGAAIQLAVAAIVVRACMTPPPAASNAVGS